VGKEASTTQLQRLLDLLQAVDDSAREALLQHSLERFRVLAKRMLRRHKDLRAREETDDVLQEALVRLYRALSKVRPLTVKAYCGLAARQIRWVLLDLVRKMASARVVSYTGAGEEPAAADSEPGDLLEWGQFHEKVDALPEEDREIFDLLLYQGLPQAEAGALLGISVRSIKRRWQEARLRLRESLRGEYPGNP
jgi:RNA polymerase sigma-70 factor (ECF subfamily)